MPKEGIRVRKFTRICNFYDLIPVFRTVFIFCRLKRDLWPTGELKLNGELDGVAQ